MELGKRFGRNVRRLRRAADISQEALAHTVGIDRSYMSGIESGARNPTIKVVGKLAEALGVSPGSLLDEE